MNPHMSRTLVTAKWWGDYARFVGRLSEEKDIQIPLRFAGDGPLVGINWARGVTCRGNQTCESVNVLMRTQRVVIVPSVWFEIGPLTVPEAFAAVTPPVSASSLGSAERLTHGRTRLLFRPGDSEDLARQVSWAFDHPEELRSMRANPRWEFEDKYTAEVVTRC